MKISLKILGFEVWSLDLDLGEKVDAEPQPQHSPVDRATKWVSRKWVRSMVS